MSELPLLAPTESDQGVHNANNQLLRDKLADVDETLSVLDAGLFSDNFRQSAWTAYTPTITAAPTVGTGGHILGAYARLADRVVVGRLSILFGTAGVSAGAGVYEISFPFNMAGVSGSGISYDSSSGRIYGFVIVHWNSNSFLIVATHIDPAVGTSHYTNGVPFAWAANDQIRGCWTGEATS